MRDHIKLSDYNRLSDFVEALIERSTNPAQINYYRSEGDIGRIEKAMKCAKELTEVANESNITLWVCTGSGIPQVAVSMGAYQANMLMIFRDGDWEEMPIDECVALFV